MSLPSRKKAWVHCEQTEGTREFVVGGRVPQRRQPNRHPLFRKTILLLGSAGSGKTSLVHAYANYLYRVREQHPYRMYIRLPEDDDADDELEESSSAPSSTSELTTFVFNNTRLSHSLAFVDTPGLGEKPTGLQVSTWEQVGDWFEREYSRPVRDLEIWYVISAQESSISHTAATELRAILTQIGAPNIKLVPVVTFAKRRKPILALKALKDIGIVAELEHVDYYTVNNGSVLGLPGDTLQTNSLSFSECYSTMRTMLIANSEPDVDMSDFLCSPGNEIACTMSSEIALSEEDVLKAEPVYAVPLGSSESHGSSSECLAASDGTFGTESVSSLGYKSDTITSRSSAGSEQSPIYAHPRSPSEHIYENPNVFDSFPSAPPSPPAHIIHPFISISAYETIV